jgi:hypothetical protein
VVPLANTSDRFLSVPSLLLHKNCPPYGNTYGPTEIGYTNKVMAKQMEEKTAQAEPLEEHAILSQITPSADLEGQVTPSVEEDAFGNEEGAELQYKTCKWW